MSTHAQDCVLAAKPNAFDIDIVGEIPNLLRSIDGIGIIATEAMRANSQLCLHSHRPPFSTAMILTALFQHY